MSETNWSCVDEENTNAVFKSYLRILLSDLEDIKENLDKKEIEQAKETLERLINDTQKGIED